MRRSESVLSDHESDTFEYISTTTFQDNYTEELQYFINDNDSLVKLKGLASSAKLFSQ